MGPREIHERTAGNRWAHGDRTLHECARRGIEEELGLESDQFTAPLLLSLQVEADFCSVVGVFQSRAPLFWPEMVVQRLLSDAADFSAEVQVIAFEPATTQNLVDLIMRPDYSVKDARRITSTDFDDRRMRRSQVQPCFYTHDQAFNPAEPLKFHPTSKGRLLRYLLSNPRRHPIQDVLDAFKKHHIYS